MNDNKKPWIIFAIGAAISAVVALIVRLFGGRKS